MPVGFIGEGLAQFVDDLEVGPALLRWVHDLGSGQDVAVTEAVMTDIVEFEGGGCGKHDVGEGCRGGHEDVGDGKEVELHEGIIGHSALCIGKERIGPLHVGALDGVGDPFQDRPSEIGGRHGHHLRYGVKGGVEHLRSLGGHQIGSDELTQTHDVGVVALNVAPLDVEVAADGHETEDGPHRVKDVDVLLDGIAPLDGRRMGRGI